LGEDEDVEKGFHDSLAQVFYHFAWQMNRTLNLM
jgi:hypothetical protein